MYGSITVDGDCIGILCSCQSYVHVNGIIHLFNGWLVLVTACVCVCVCVNSNVKEGLFL